MGEYRQLAISDNLAAKLIVLERIIQDFKMCNIPPDYVILFFYSTVGENVST